MRNKTKAIVELTNRAIKGLSIMRHITYWFNSQPAILKAKANPTIMDGSFMKDSISQEQEKQLRLSRTPTKR